MSKTNKILGVLLAIQLLLTGYLFWSGRSTVNPGVELLGGLTADQVQRLVVGESADRQVVLNKKGKEWLVELAPGRDYPADPEKVESMLGRLAGLKSGRLVSRTKGGQRRLEVAADQYNRKVELVTEKGSRTLYLGTSPSYQSIHARVGDSDEVYLIRDLAAWELPGESSGWWQTRYLDVDPAQVLEVELSNRQGTLHLSRTSAEESWRFDGEAGQPDAKKVADLLPALCRVTINQVVADTAWQPKGQPEATLKLKTGDRQEELTIWPRPDEKSDYPVKVGGSEFYAKAGGYSVEPILNAKAAALQPEAPKPEPATKSATKPENIKPDGKERKG